MTDTHSRSIVKSITWRVLGTITTGAVAFIMTGSFRITVAILSVEVLAKTLIYYVHERAWHKISWGRLKR